MARAESRELASSVPVLEYFTPCTGNGRPRYSARSSGCTDGPVQVDASSTGQLDVPVRGRATCSNQLVGPV
jgi:hypothetical protein